MTHSCLFSTFPHPRRRRRVHRGGRGCIGETGDSITQFHVCETPFRVAIPRDHSFPLFPRQRLTATCLPAPCTVSPGGGVTTINRIYNLMVWTSLSLGPALTPTRERGERAGDTCKDASEVNFVTSGSKHAGGGRDRPQVFLLPPPVSRCE